MELNLTYLAREESLKPLLEEQFTSSLYAADPKLGLCRDLAKVWNVSDEDPVAATTTIAVGRLMSSSSHLPQRSAVVPEKL